ncbi:MAG: transketolase C-terminal domain-containing protein, partial [Lawsonella sp.]
EHDQKDHMHTTDAIDPETGEALEPRKPGWTAVFAREMLQLAAKDPDMVAISAAMAGPVGLAPFREKYPDRFFDVGIAEQHALTSASGLALGGKKPVVAIYSTFMNRAFDQLLMDVALIKQPVTVVLDRAGVTGPDGASHNGMWDLSLLSIVPGVKVAAPRDPLRLRMELREAVRVEDGPTVIRIPKGIVVDDIPEIRQTGDGVDVLYENGNDILLVAVGTFARRGLAAAKRLAEKGIKMTVIDPRWVLPIPESVIEMAGQAKMVVVYEDNGINGGVGSVLGNELNKRECDVPIRQLALRQEFLDIGTRREVLREHGLNVDTATERIENWWRSLSGE